MSEIGSSTYTRAVRAQIEQFALGAGRNETECLSVLHEKLSASRNRRAAPHRGASFDDLVFLPANLTRLVIDPYREPCSTRTIIGPRAEKPLNLSGPLLIGGIPFSHLPAGVLQALCLATQSAEIALRAPHALRLPAEDLRVIREMPMGGGRQLVDGASAVELATGPAGPLDPASLRQAVDAYRRSGLKVPIGVGVGSEEVAANVQAAVEAGLDFVTIHAMPQRKDSSGWVELTGEPRIGVLTEAVAGLRSIGHEGDIDLVYFGCIRDGADVAKALALGATAVMIGQAALIAAGVGLSSDDPASTLDISESSDRLNRFIKATLIEASVLTRGCGKSDLHNLEPEDLRSLSLETSRATGIPLVGSDTVSRTGQ